jgi:glutathione peroxidase
MLLVSALETGENEPQGRSRMLFARPILFTLMALAMTSFANSAVTSNFYDLSATDINGKKVHFTQYRGKVVLVVNTASKCGFTPQLKDLEELYKKYGARGFTILAFPSNDFRQEKGDNEELLKFAKKEYGTTFPFFEKGIVSGSKKQPVYRFLTEQKSGLLFREVSWNFEKFLINRQGTVIERWNSMTSPSSESVIRKIEKALDEPI